MADLPRRQLGRTGLQVTMLGYGAMELRGAPRARDISEAQAETILGAVLDAGINYIDTSIITASARSVLAAISRIGATATIWQANAGAWSGEQAVSGHSIGRGAPQSTVLGSCRSRTLSWSKPTGLVRNSAAPNSSARRRRSLSP